MVEPWVSDKVNPSVAMEISGEFVLTETKVDVIIAEIVGNVMIPEKELIKII